MEAKGHCWRFSPEGKSTANGVIINVWRFEFLSPATPPLCPESSDYSSCTEHTFTPIKVSTENLTFTLRMSITSLKLSCLHSKMFLSCCLALHCKTKNKSLADCSWETNQTTLLAHLISPPSALIGTARIIMFITVCKAHLKKKTFLRKYVFWGII